jgi:hypothetical protein
MSVAISGVVQLKVAATMLKQLGDGRTDQGDGAGMVILSIRALQTLLLGTNQQKCHGPLVIHSRVRLLWPATFKISAMLAPCS